LCPVGDWSVFTRQFGVSTSDMNYLKKVLFTINDSILTPKEKQLINDIKKYVSIISESSGRTRLKAVKEIARLCDLSENKEILCSNEDLSLLSRLKTFLSIIKYDDNCVYWLIGCLNMLSSGSSSCKIAIASVSLDLLPILMKILSSSSDEKMIMVIEMTISNCSQCESCHPYLLSSEIGWLDHLVKRLLEKSDDYHSYLLFNNFIANMKNSNILIMNSERNIPEILFQKLYSFGSLEKKWNKEEHEIADLIIRSIMHLSKSLAGVNYIRNCFLFHPQYSSFFFDLLSSSAFTLLGVRITIIIANIYGSEEKNDRKKALLEIYPEILDDLLDIMNGILHFNIEKGEIKMIMKKGFLYGRIQLSDVVIALKNIMISEENKVIIKKKYSRLLILSYQTIKLFLENTSECKGMNPGEAFYEYGGGGGKDHLTIENVLELLLQFSFVFDDEKELQTAFSSLSLSPSHASSSPSHASISYDLKKMLEELLSLSNERNVSSASKQFARLLLTKLDSSKKRSGGMMNGGGLGDFFHGNNNSNNNSAKHIMLSYCPSASSSEKELVTTFGKQLKELGYDVWRDEEGSSILPAPLLPENIDHISHVIDKSYAVIVFLSSEYKENTLCRIEGNLAYNKAMTATGPSSSPQLIYVMLNEQYTTRSHPRQIDGWLTNLINNDMTWYPLWNKDFLDSTLLAIVDELGNHGKLTFNAPFALKPSSHGSKGSTVVTSPTVVMNPPSTPSRNRSASSASFASSAAVPTTTASGGGGSSSSSSYPFSLKFPSPMKRSPSSTGFCFSPISRSHSSFSNAGPSSSSSSSSSTPTPTPTKDMFQSIFSMKLDDDADFATAFHCLTEDKSICRESFRNVLKSLNVSEPEDLQYADMATILGNSGLLKPRYRHIFFKALHLEY
jgi:hypothetical protein